jgi:proteic killer suppression protein
MILGYKGKKTRDFAEGKYVAQFEAFRFQAEKRLRILEAAENLLDLAQLPSNRLETLSGNRKGQYSIRINQQWRICFEWSKELKGPDKVEITDYH